MGFGGSKEDVVGWGGKVEGAGCWGVKDLRCSRPEDECGSSRRSNQRVPLITRGWIAAVGVGKWEDVKPNLSALAWCVVCWGRKKKTQETKKPKSPKS